MQISQVRRYTLNQILIEYDEKDISANFYKILLNVLHNLSLTFLLPWQHTGSQTSPILKAFLATFGVSLHICKWCLIYMIQQAYKHVRLSLWPCLTFFELKITYILRSSGWGLDKDCFIIGGDILNFVSHHCTYTTDYVISDQILIIGKT